MKQLAKFHRLLLVALSSTVLLAGAAQAASSSDDIKKTASEAYLSIAARFRLCLKNT